MHRLAYATVIILFVLSGCQSSKVIKKELLQTTKKEYRITKYDILKKFKKPQRSIMYSKPELQHYLNYALWNNKEIDVEIAQLLKLYNEMKSIYLEDPEFGITLAPIYRAFRAGAPLLREFMFSQKFPTADKLPFERKIIYFQTRAQYFQVLKKALDIQQEITVNLLLWEKLKKIITIKRNKLVILERIKKYLVDSISFHQEEGYFNEIININLKITSITKEIATLKSTIKSIKNELGRLVYIKQYQKLALPGLKILHILGKRNIFRDLSLNPELLKYKQIIEKSRIEVDRSIKNFIPDITLNLGITLKSMDPVANFMGKKGLLSALMMNLPVYKEKLSAQIESRIFENYAARFELTMKEREILRDFFRNNIEFYLNKIILKIVDKEIKEVKTIKNYTKKLISLAKTNLINNLEIEIMLFDYIETRISYSYDKTIANLKNRFLVGKFILGGER